MSRFPDRIKVKLIRDGNNFPLSNIAIRIRLFAKHKNDYKFIPPVSDKDGIIEITKEWLTREIEKERNLFIMDYSSNLYDCDSKIEFTVMDYTEIQKAVNGLKLYKKALNISDKEIQQLSQVDNHKYYPLSKLLEFRNEREVTFDLILKPFLV